MTRRVALLGLSGVGKSTFISRVARQSPLLHLQASSLIKAEQARREQNPESSEELRTGAVLNNQELLVAAFLRTAGGSALPIVFDGHSVVDGQNGLVEIPASVFAALRLTGIFFLRADPLVIAQRRTADVHRSRPFREPGTLAEHQRIARDVSRRIAHEIGCEFQEITAADMSKFAQALALQHE
ncbi:ATP-binding protein [Sphingomonas olei]|uniref:Adenylate kinase n=1 Tax=Sphingomonas olei TaxID=1886787 RepID=A0ABY2QIX8_9SPHN|nr:AAA family ATPase [Sphingomonas olei]THG40423.1 adenylate kinase [Sphingomonas olei]